MALHKPQAKENVSRRHKKAPSPHPLEDDLEDDVVVVVDEAEAPRSAKKKRTLDDILEDHQREKKRSKKEKKQQKANRRKEKAQEQSTPAPEPKPAPEPESARAEKKKKKKKEKSSKKEKRAPPAVQERAPQPAPSEKKKKEKKARDRKQAEPEPTEPETKDNGGPRWGLASPDANYANPLDLAAARGRGRPSTTGRPGSDSEDEDGGRTIEARLKAFEWAMEIRELVQHLAHDETGVQFAHTVLQNWDTEKLTALCFGMHPIHLARLAGGWPAEKAAAVLSALPENASLLRATRELEPEDLVSILPLLPPKRVRAVLDGLYFASQDPHISGREVREIIEALGPEGGKARRRALKGLEPGAVAAVLRGEDPKGGGDGSESYESSFVVSDSEDEEGLLEDEAGSESGSESESGSG